MAEELVVDTQASREEKYQGLLPQLEALTEGEDDLIANVANLCAAIRETFGFLWVGCYFVKGEELVLGPFQGPIACTRIAFGRGVCGTAWKDKATVIVPDVEQFPGHIACSSASRSEIVLPAFDANGNVALVLDIDSEQIRDFTELDQTYLQKVIQIIESKLTA